jgi:hypothetical protein
MPVSREANPRLFVAGQIHGSLESPNLAGGSWRSQRPHLVP